MPQHVYEGRRRVYVSPYTGCPILYGFKTNVPAAIGTSCGHTAVPANAPANLVFGANSPKPGRAKTSAAGGGSRSSFYDKGVYATLAADGDWTLTFPRRRRGGGNSLNSVAVWVRVGPDGDAATMIKYAWNIPSLLLTKIGAANAAAMGIREVTDNDDVVWGADFPKPPKAKTVEIGVDGADTLSTWVETGATLPDGWSLVGGEQMAP